MEQPRHDEMIETALSDHLRWDTRIPKDSDIDFSVDNGRVTFRGVVPTMAARQAVTDGAWMIDGVLDVQNDLVVQPAGGTPPDDGEIQTRIESMLRWNPSLAPHEIDVQVEDGAVSLGGTVANYWEKQHAGEYASQMEGVKDVRNNLQVQPDGPHQDELIVAQIRAAIERDQRISQGNNIDIQAEGGCVTLRGTVSRWSSKTAAFNAACRTPGVTAVQDELTILHGSAP